MLKGFSCCCGESVPFAQCLERSRSHPDDCPFVYPILQGMVNGIRGEVEGISVTSMLNCLRKVILEKRHDFFVDPKQLFYAFRGQMFHTIAELVTLLRQLLDTAKTKVQNELNVLALAYNELH